MNLQVRWLLTFKRHIREIFTLIKGIVKAFLGLMLNLFWIAKRLRLRRVDALTFSTLRVLTASACAARP
jgi:hypothetical protein